MASFIEKLRAPNVYGGRNPFSPREENPFEMLDQFRMRLPPDSGLQQVGQAMQQPPVEKPPMDVVYRDFINPVDQAKLDQRRAEQEARERIAGGGIESREKIASEREATRRELEDKRIAGRETLQEMRARQAAELEANRQTGRESLADINARHAMERVRASGEEAREIQGLRGEQALEQIGARIAGQKDVQANKPPLASQKKTSAQVNYNKLINMKPEYRKFVKMGPDGMPVIQESKPGGLIFGASGPTEEQKKEIMEFIYGSAGEEKPVTEEPVVVDDPNKPKETPEQRLARLKKAAGVK